jgi:hypothetical protein
MEKGHRTLRFLASELSPPSEDSILDRDFSFVRSNRVGIDVY